MSLSLCKKRRTQEVDNGAIKRPRNENLSTTHGNLSQSQLMQNNVRCGKVIKIQLINFMCHANLSIDFHPRVNFLVGSNGSGKSAILAALVLGLGAKAKATNRSASMKQFIKNGENTAKIMITLENSGPESYEADVYGDEITVVRSITQHGATFIIKNKLGDVISRKADELHRILMYHNVQVENPVFVLNQDNAREFLKDLEPSRNYKLFLKATQLETVMDKLNDCLHSYRDQQRRMQCFNLAIQNRRQEIESLNAKYRQLMSVEELKSELATKELERSWLTVAQEEKELQEFCEKIEAREQKQKSLLEMVKNRSEVELELKKEIRQFEEQISNKTSSIAEANSLCNQTRTQFNKIQDRCGELESFLSSFKKRYAFLEGQIKELKNNIEERSKNNVGDIAEVRERNENALSDLKNMLEETEAIIGTVTRDLQILVENKRQQEEKIGEIRRHQNSLDEEMRRIQSHIRNIQASSKDKLSIYGEDVSNFLMEIDKYYKAGKFSELPRGPIGRYIEVPNSKFRDVVENQMQGLLRAFIVTNTKDRLVLESILKNNFPNYHPVIITMRFMKQVYDVTRGSVSPTRGTRLLMHEIRCSDPVVMNCLIDRVQLETILLAETKDIAEHLTSHRENVPQNLNKVIVPQPGLEYYPEPQYRMYSMKIRPASLIQVHVKDRINQLEAEHLERRQRFQQYAEESAAQEHQLKEDMKLIQEKRDELEKYAAKKREMREDMLELENFQYPEHNEVDILKRELQEHEIKLDQVKAKIVTKKAELTEAYDEKQRLEIELKSRKTSLQSIESEINELKTTSEGTQAKLRSLANRVKDNEDKIKCLSEVVKELKNEKESKLAALNKAINAAQSRGDRIATTSSDVELHEEIQRIKAKLKHTSNLTDDPKQIAELIRATKHTMDSDVSAYDGFKRSIEMLKNSRHKRCDLIKRLKQHMVMLLQFSFDHILNLRNFSGSIDVSHTEKTLLVSVVPRDNHLDNCVSSTRALSGGERSFSTIAFLLALWSCVDHPFYFLDEYDVFTDEVNREYMTRLLINEGKKKPTRQYVFLTPQDMSIISKDYIKIHRFSEPERR